MPPQFVEHDIKHNFRLLLALCTCSWRTHAALLRAAISVANRPLTHSLRISGWPKRHACLRLAAQAHSAKSRESAAGPGP